MSNLVMWNLIVGFLLPNLLAIIQQPKFSSTVRAAITAAVSVVGGVGTAYFNDAFNTGDVVGSILVCAVAAITFYKGFWKPTGVATKIENATSSGSQPPTELLHPDDAPVDGNVNGRHERGEIGLTQALVCIAALIVVLIVASWLVR